MIAGVVCLFSLGLAVVKATDTCSSPAEANVDGTVSFLQSGTRLHDESDNGIMSSTQSTDLGMEAAQGSCVDQSSLGGLGLLVAQINHFWASKKKTAYPFMLTGLAALKYGSVTVDSNGQAFTFDHDLDFLVQMPGASYEEAYHMVQEWQASVFIELGILAQDVMKTPIGFFARRPNVHDPDTFGKLGAWNFWTWVNVESLVGGQIQSSDAPETIFEKYMPPGTHSINVTDDVHIPESTAAKFFRHRAKGLTQIDFWVKGGEPLDERYQAAPGKKMMFMGSGFPAANDVQGTLYEEILRSYNCTLGDNGDFCSLSNRSSIKDMCGMARLCSTNNETDFFCEASGLNSKSVKDLASLAKTCTKTLSFLGYESLAECDWDM